MSYLEVVYVIRTAFSSRYYMIDGEFLKGYRFHAKLADAVVSCIQPNPEFLVSLAVPVTRTAHCQDILKECETTPG